ncbi:phage replisome organizer N-terminal domain-containing protein [Phascolarctobacterium succinatutens]|jgi:hypothetical protein|uniref:Phage replisome organiser N-terminal domain-containing protein n=1 Tax=Phascolarctobacterium succinatutens TaxID=626940 RepID=A0A1Q6R2X8_9FIRM|nr:phage replisome organizer N-terminal domain-containing protein [Phascolarctobacterium succinatutens]MBS5425875.1 phage replisome organizer N-terminal domain-containing protein [Phascolarctobacterium succinatutens]OLA36734.1 MAG: hypothetical protein BHW43_08840 [Phascolarctobacterium succinatutens]
MAKKKIFYYIMLKKDFFVDPIVMMLRSKPNGADLFRVYLHLLVRYVTDLGIITYYKEIDAPLENQLEWEIQEDPELIREVIDVLKKRRMLIQITDDKMYISAIEPYVGVDTNFAIQKRLDRMRAEYKGKNGDNINGNVYSNKDNTSDSVGNRGDKDNNDVGASDDNVDNGNNSGPLADVVKNFKAKSETGHQKKMASARLAEIGVMGKVVDEIAAWATVQQINDVYRSIDGATNINNKPGALVAALRANKAQLTAPRAKNITCPNCNGQGVVLDADRDDGSMCMCPICNGSGQITQV